MELEKFYESYFPFWSKLADADQRLLCESTVEERFERSQPIHDNMDCSGIYIVRSGRLRLYMLSEDGKEITLYRLTPGDICMLSASCVLQSVTFDIYLDAEEVSDCYYISGSTFGDVSNRYLEVKNYTLETAREVITRILKHLASDGLIEVTRKGIVITDKKKLRSIAY